MRFRPHHLASALSFLASIAAPLGARAQTVVRPSFLLVVDDSGSMTTATTGVGTNSCGYARTRINDVGCTVRNIADGIGDATFGMSLMSIQCRAAPNPHYFGGIGCGTGVCPAAPAALPATLLWPNLPFPLYGCPNTSIVAVPLDETQRGLLRSWGDGAWTSCVAAPAVGTLGGPELTQFAADPNGAAVNGNTPNAGQMRFAYNYLHNGVVGLTSPYINFNGTGAPDPYMACRPMNIVMLTDGAENCSGVNGAPANAQNLGCLQVDLNGNAVLEDPIPASDPNPALRGRFETNRDLNADGDCYDAGEQRAFRTHTFAIGFGTGCRNANIENTAQRGGVALHTISCSATPSYGYYATNEDEVAEAISDIIASSDLHELCNGLDDDCDGVVDNGYVLGGPCTAGVGACRRAGTVVCDVSQLGTTCNAVPGAPGTETTTATCTDGIDNDCDGFVDCGDPGCALIPACLGSCVPSAEVCDGRDNNCDGQVDEGAIMRPCGSNVGICTAGTQTCQTQAFPGSGTGIWSACSGIGPAGETCNNLDDDCNGAIDDGLTQACGMGVGACRPGIQRCTAGSFSGPCIGAIGPSPEICDGADNNCDGMTDEGNPGGGASCGIATGACTPGMTQCLGGTLMCVGGVGGTPEVCNGIDDDCNGVVDDGIPGAGAACDGGFTFPGGVAMGACRQGTLVCAGGPGLVCQGAVGPMPEVCNGIDDDCDGVIDNGSPGGGASCGISVGACMPGMTMCVGGTLMCLGATGPTPELCNGIDDDCNGIIDDGLPVGAACGTSLGECVPGVNVCMGGGLVCSGGVGPTTETCNGLDDNCDGVVDDGDPGGGGACGTTVGMCMAGTEHCLMGRLVCEGGVPGGTEVCDCVDNDCNGMVDDPPPGGSLCPAGSACIMCACSVPCEVTEFGTHCPSGRTPYTDPVSTMCYCVAPACDTTSCAAQTITNPDGTPDCGPGATATSTCVCRNNACVGPCDGVLCIAGLVCDPHSSTGTCVEDNCRGLGCPSGQICDTGSGACHADPCATVTCPSGQACRDGMCEASCATVTCSGGDVCRHGTCVPDPCTGVTCSGTTVCNPADGTCVADMCGARSCRTGELCDPPTGMCMPDPCASLHCPGDEVCITGECMPRGTMPDAGPISMDGGHGDGGPITRRVLASGGGGCSAGGAGGTSSLPFAFLALALLALLRRKGARALSLRRSNTALVLAGGLTLAMTGCNVQPYCLDCLDGGGADAARDANDGAPTADTGADAGMPDTGPPDLGLPDGCTAGATELCNGVDDNCDGRIDEGFDLTRDPDNCGHCGSVCSPPGAFGACVASVCTIGSCDVGHYDLNHDPADGCEYRCVPTAMNDMICDRRDDDCDGMIDEDVDLTTDRDNCGSCGHSCRFPHAMGACVASACTRGPCDAGFFDINGDLSDGCEYSCTPSSPATEVCNGRDDDCNGIVDDGDPGGGGTCGSSVGTCVAGVNHCMMGAILCTGSVVPAVETCNGMDDDCNGTVDDNLGSDLRIGSSCGSGLGECRRGTNVCMAGGIVCMGGLGPTMEVCNGRDDNCNGTIDDGLGSLGSCGIMVGSCMAGSLMCTSGAVVCTGATGPMLEACNGIDDDCDGVIDNGYDLLHDINNCGMCGRTCSFPHAIAGCTTGSCAILACNVGFVDLNGLPGDGCEYACSFSGTEICDGVDNNCNGSIDEGLSPPPGLCRTAGACAGATASCSGTSAGFTCSYGPNVEVDPMTHQPVPVETRCDAIDNNCNGSVDESFANLGTACNNGGTGTCFGSGTFVCRADHTGTQCNAPAVGTPGTETCNGLDDDCDGSIDENRTAPGTNASFVNTSWVQYAPSRWIMQYEASRPAASMVSQGTASNRACSVLNVLPWTNMNYAQATAACAAAGATLCNETTQWQVACSAPAACTWAYTTTCSTYSTTKCNDAELAGPSALRPTGSLASCAAATTGGNAFDLSGNAKEMCIARASGAIPLRGGAYTNDGFGIQCGFAWTVVSASYAFPDTGFRCCFDGVTPP